MSKKTLATIAISLLTVALGIVCLFVLPDRVAVQWSISGGVSNVISKYLAVFGSWGVTGLLLLMSYSRNSYKYTATSLIGIFLQVMYLIMNR